MAGMDILYSANFNLEQNCVMKDVAAALTALNNAIATWNLPGRPLPMRVSPLPIAYPTANARQQDFNIYLNRNPDVRQQLTEDEWDQEIEAYGIMPDALHQATQRRNFFYIAVMPNPVFTHSFTLERLGDHDLAAARAAHHRRDVPWHELVVMLDKRKVYVYDPSYKQDPPQSGPRRSIQRMGMMGGGRVAGLLQKLSAPANRGGRGLRIDEVWVGGGGSSGEDCSRKMNLRWIRSWVEAIICETALPDVRARWERVSK